MSTPTEKPARGGYRPGSGQKPLEPGGMMIGFYLFPRHLEKIEARKQRDGISRAAALRQIIEESN